MKECRLVMTNELEGRKVKSLYYILTNFLTIVRLQHDWPLLMFGQRSFEAYEINENLEKHLPVLNETTFYALKENFFLLFWLLSLLILINHSLLSLLLMVFRQLSLSTLTSYRPDKMPQSQWWVSAATTLRTPLSWTKLLLIEVSLSITSVLTQILAGKVIFFSCYFFQTLAILIVKYVSLFWC